MIALGFWSCGFVSGIFITKYLVFNMEIGRKYNWLIKSVIATKFIQGISGM